SGPGPETRDPPGSGCPGAGAGPPPGSPCRREGRGPRGWREAARAGLSVPPCTSPACRACPPPCPGVAPCPRPHGFLSPRSPCDTPAGPMSLRCPCPQAQAVARIPGVPTASPPCPHGVPTLSPCPQAGLAQCQREAEEVAELMRQNMTRALEREGRLEQLQSRAQDLRQASEAFTRTTQTVTRRQRRRHQRWRLVALGLGLLLLFILGLALALALARSSPGTVTGTVPTPQGGTSTPPALQGHQ
ncbi:VAMP5 protein, partial [Oreocharis arfaki]|nr:VAMP5 protein [Oreocharis arfaki]